MFRQASCLLIALLLTLPVSVKAESAAARRGRAALMKKRFWPAVFPPGTYENAWKRWGLKRKPRDYDRKFNARYGLHKSPDKKATLPMGLRPGTKGRGVALDCLICHSGSINGKSYVGLPNATLDYQRLADELTPKGGQKPDFGGVDLTQARGLTPAAPATVAAFSMRNADLSNRRKPLPLNQLKVVPEDPPAWWLLYKKKTMYHTGMVDANSTRSPMIFLLDPRNDLAVFKREEQAFADILAYLKTLRPPKYPFDVDRRLAATGRKLFVKNCSECHGTYGKNWKYPNRIIPINQIKTDPMRHRAYSKKMVTHYNAGWFGKKHKMRVSTGYQAPPLDGIWATAPYLHNGSVPTVYHVLNSKSRPALYTRSYRTDKDAIDTHNLGWKFTTLKPAAMKKLRPVERRRVYNTRLPGQSNAGHTYGDHLTDPQRRAIIEYLKTI